MYTKYITILFVVALLIAATGCTTSAKPPQELPDLIQVQMNMPETFAALEAYELQVQVSQGQTPVEDADEVMFEIWLEGSKEESEMIAAAHQGKGIYSVMKTFPEDGLYYIQSHVTARSMHAMPKQSVLVGTGGIREPQQEKSREAAHKH